MPQPLSLAKPAPPTPEPTPTPRSMPVPSWASGSRPVEPRSAPLQVASLWRRATGMLWAALWFFRGGVLLLLVVLGAARALGADVVTFWNDERGTALVDLVICVLMIVMPLTRSVRHEPGSSLAQLAFQTEVAMLDGTRVTARASLVRSTALIGPFLLGCGVWPLAGLSEALPDGLILLAGIAVYGWVLADIGIAPLIGEQRRTLHDRLAGTVVVEIGAQRAPLDDRPRSIGTRPRGPLSIGLLVAVLAVITWLFPFFQGPVLQRLFG